MWVSSWIIAESQIFNECMISSSQICNAGFVVCPNHRGNGYGSILGRSYLHYGPKLGYRASVFNLVYVNNTASVRSGSLQVSAKLECPLPLWNHTNSFRNRIWESLNFTKAGLIPKAGRLKRADGQGEEYVDAWVFYKSFVDEWRDAVSSSVSMSRFWLLSDIHWPSDSDAVPSEGLYSSKHYVVNTFCWLDIIKRGELLCGVCF